MEYRRDKAIAPQKEKKMTTKTVIDLVTSCKMIFAKVLVYNPVVLEKMRGWLDVLKTQI